MHKALYILGDLTDQDIQFLSEAGSVNKLSAEQTIIEAGNAVEALFIITEGKFAVETTDGTHIAELSVGDVVGEMSLVENRLPEANVVAKADSRVLVVPREALLSQLDNEPRFAARFYKALATFLSDRLRNTMNSTSDEGGEKLNVMHVADERIEYLMVMLDSEKA